MIRVECQIAMSSNWILIRSDLVHDAMDEESRMHIHKNQHGDFSAQSIDWKLNFWGKIWGGFRASRAIMENFAILRGFEGLLTPRKPFLCHFMEMLQTFGEKVLEKRIKCLRNSPFADSKRFSFTRVRFCLSKPSKVPPGIFNSRQMSQIS